jgi:hypothetical protein
MFSGLVSGCRHHAEVAAHGSGCWAATGRRAGVVKEPVREGVRGVLDSEHRDSMLAPQVEKGAVSRRRGREHRAALLRDRRIIHPLAQTLAILSPTDMFLSPPPLGSGFVPQTQCFARTRF